MQISLTRAYMLLCSHGLSVSIEQQVVAKTRSPMLGRKLREDLAQSLEQ
jgi:hypothetical protein